MSDNNYEKNYNDDTITYIDNRVEKECPLSCDTMTDDNAFKYPYIWNALTGEIEGKDPHGPLYFNPAWIYRYIHSNILNGLWLNIEGCAGQHDVYLGRGQDFVRPNKIPEPNRYIFRVPIQDCYCLHDHNDSLFTLSPKLTDDDVQEIDRLIQEYNMDEVSGIYNDNTTLSKLKELYDIALNPYPSMKSEDIPNSINNKFMLEVVNNGHMFESRVLLNRCAVNELCKIKKVIKYR